MPSRTVELSSPDITSAERDIVDAVLRSGRLSRGPYIREFEHAFAARAGVAEGVAVSSGTAGLHLSLISANVGEGDVVITTPFSFVATANSILYQRATPHFVDIDPLTLALDTTRTLDAIETLARGGKLKAVMPVHVFGVIGDVQPIVDAARQRGIVVIEDACEAVGATRDDIPAGRFGDLAVFAFYPNKQMTTGEGGMVLTDDPRTAALLRSLRNHGRAAGGEDFERLGFNYRLDELRAALGLAQLHRLEEMLRSRATVAAMYGERLAQHEWVTPMHQHEGMTWFIYSIRLEASLDRDLLITRLAARGIVTRAYFKPIHLQPYYRDRFGYRPGDYPHAEAVGSSALALPFHAGLTEDDVDYVCACLDEEIAALTETTRRRVHARA